MARALAVSYVHGYKSMALDISCVHGSKSVAREIWYAHGSPSVALDISCVHESNSAVLDVSYVHGSKSVALDIVYVHGSKSVARSWALSVALQGYPMGLCKNHRYFGVQGLGHISSFQCVGVGIGAAGTSYSVPQTS